MALALAPVPPPPVKITEPPKTAPANPEPPAVNVRLATLVAVSNAEKVAPVPEPFAVIVGTVVKFVPPEVTVTLAIGPVQVPVAASDFEEAGLSKPSQLWQ